MDDAPALLTVGHGTLELDALIALLRGAGVEQLVDIRAFPGSRRVPHTAREVLEAALPAAGVEYRWDPRLGGRRRGAPDSPNVALRQDAFRAYADHIATAEFAVARAELLAEASARPTTVMCSESVWWRCHRRLVADAVVLLDGFAVEHLFHDGRRTPHPVLEAARVDGDHLVYDAGVDRSE